jgi:hypothetical protein
MPHPSASPQTCSTSSCRLKCGGRANDTAFITDRIRTRKGFVNAVVYLENAPFVTGEILHVDGGQSAGH